jgi:hypothetical protein
MPMGVAGVFKVAPVLSITTIMAKVPIKEKGRRSFFMLIFIYTKDIEILKVFSAKIFYFPCGEMFCHKDTKTQSFVSPAGKLDCH